MKTWVVIIVLVIIGIAYASPYIKKNEIQSMRIRMDCLEREVAMLRDRIEDFIRSSEP